MWNSIFCEGKRVIKVDGWKFWKWYMDYRVSPPKEFVEKTEPPYIVVPTGSKGFVLLYGRQKQEVVKKK